MTEAAAPPRESPPPTAPPATAPPGAGLELPIGKISPFGNVRDVRGPELKELASTIRDEGVLEPVLVVPIAGLPPERRPEFDPKGKGYEYRLVAGFRRVAAAELAGLKTIPARVLQLTEEEILSAQLVENLQRAALSPIQEGAAFRAYLETTKKTQEDLAKRLGRDRSFVANRVRLLALPKPVLDLVDAGRLSSSHAEILLKVPKEGEPIAVELAKSAARGAWSVEELNRQVTWRVKQHLERIEFAKRIAASKFPTCPTCKKRADSEADSYNGKGMVRHDQSYDPRHTWRLSDGKLLQAVLEERDAANRKAEARSRSAPAPKRDLSQPATTRSFGSPAVIARRILEQLGDKGVEEVYIDRGCTVNDGESPCLHVHVRDKFMESLPLPENVDVQLLRVEPAAYSTGEQSRVVVQEGAYGFDAAARKKGIAAFHDWSRKSLPAGKPKKDVLEVDAKLLEGNVTEVLNRLEKGKAGARLADNLELIEQLRVLEGAGANRPTVLERFDEWLRVEGGSY